MMKKTKHWLHILLTILTGGFWLFPYVLVVATNEIFNRGHREGKQAGRVERQNEIDEERETPKVAWVSKPDPRTMPNCRCVARPIDVDEFGMHQSEQHKKQNRIDRFEYLCRKKNSSYLTDLERIELVGLREELTNG